MDSRSELGLGPSDIPRRPWWNDIGVIQMLFLGRSLFVRCLRLESWSSTTLGADSDQLAPLIN